MEKYRVCKAMRGDQEREVRGRVWYEAGRRGIVENEEMGRWSCSIDAMVMLLYLG